MNCEVIDSVQTRFPILSYHAIRADGQRRLPPQWSVEHAVGLGEFRRQMDLIAAGGWEVLDLNRMETSARRRCVAITFDDGEASDLLAAQELRERQLTAAFFVTWSRLGAPSFLTRMQVQQLDREGFVIGSHCMTHTRLTELSAFHLHEQLAGSKKRLEDLLGKSVSALAIPFGAYNQGVLAAAGEAGYRSILTSDFALAVAGARVQPRITIGCWTTIGEFEALLSQRSFAIARRRVINGLYRRLTRLVPAAAGKSGAGGAQVSP
jgi:peptidoglycan/xylan/chitin deacetylase (PgdA/CDA1 family)